MVHDLDIEALVGPGMVEAIVHHGLQSEVRQLAHNRM